MTLKIDGIQTAADLWGNPALLSRYAPTKTNKRERGELYRYFMQKINPSRIKDGYKPLTESRLGYLLEGIKTGDLYVLQKKCDEARNFGSYFNWATNPKNAKLPSTTKN